MTTKIKARVWLDEQKEPIIMDVMNPGGWFGNCHVLQFAIANALNPFLIVEASTPDEAIDNLADNDEWGNLINDEEAQQERDNWDLNHGPNSEWAANSGNEGAEEEEPEWCTAGNDSHCVNLDNVAFCKFDKIEYFIELDRENWSETAAIADILKED